MPTFLSTLLFEIMDFLLGGGPSAAIGLIVSEEEDGL